MKTDQERRVILAIALSVLVLMSWQWFFPPPEPPAAPADGQTDVVDGTDPTGATPAIASAAPAPAAPPAAVENIVPHSQPLQYTGGSAVVSSENGALQVITLDEYDAMVKVMPIWTWAMGKFSGESEESWVPYSGGDTARQVIDNDGGVVLAGAGPLDDDGAGTPGGASSYRVEKSGNSVVATRRRADGLTITKTYTPGEMEFTTRVKVTVTNGSGSTIGPVWVGVAERMEGSAGSMFDRSANVTHPQAYVDGLESVMSPDDVEGADLERFTGPVSWFGVADRYFAAVLIPTDGGAEGEGPEGVVVMDALPGGRLGSFFIDETALDAGATRSFEFTAYTGPKRLETLREVAPNLDESVEYGWFGFFSKILLLFLEFFHAGVGNWGVAIILLTLTIKLLFFRLNERALASSEKMKKLQPEIEKLRETYKDDQQLQSQEMMKLWQKHGVSPLGGCLPMLVQMPVFFALYTVMYYSVELYDAQFLYLQDLTATDPYGVIPTLYAILMVAQQSMMPTANMDPTQARMMKMMPLFFAFIMFSFPSGLVMYFCVNMLLTIIQQYIIRRRLAAEPAAA